MAKITWVTPDNQQITADIPNGQNLMEAAVTANVPGIVGECGGNLSCATCHVYVDDTWQAKAGELGDFEDAMLDAAEAERKDSSRLSCQITASDELDGIVIHVPAV